MTTYVMAVESKIETFYEVEADSPEDARKKFMMSDHQVQELDHLKRNNGIIRVHVLDEDADLLLLAI